MEPSRKYQKQRDEPRETILEDPPLEEVQRLKEVIDYLDLAHQSMAQRAKETIERLNSDNQKKIQRLHLANQKKIQRLNSDNQKKIQRLEQRIEAMETERANMEAERDEMANEMEAERTNMEEERSQMQRQMKVMILRGRPISSQQLPQKRTAPPSLVGRISPDYPVSPNLFDDSDSPPQTQTLPPQPRSRADDPSSNSSLDDLATHPYGLP